MSLPPFQVLLDQHGPAVHRFLLASVGATDADDCYQEACIAALRAYPDLEHAQNLKGWLMTVAHRKAVDAHRARARRPVPVERVPEQAARDGAPATPRIRSGPRCASCPRSSAPPCSCAAWATCPTPRWRRRWAARRTPPGAACTRGSSGCARRCPREGAEPARGRARPARGAAGRGLRHGRLAVRAADGGRNRARAWSCSPTPSTSPARCWSGWPASCRRACSRRPRGWTASGASSTSTSRAGGASSRPRWTSRSRAASTARCWRPRRRIGYGQTTTYAGVAAEAGNAKAVRAAGSGLGSNPIPVVVPCHRVLRTGGALGGYTGGLERKEFLLSLERR